MGIRIDQGHPIQLLIADDSPAVRAGLHSAVFGTEIRIAAEASNGNEACRLATEFNVDVILLDIHMPECDGLAALPLLKAVRPHVPVLILSSHDDPHLIKRACELGAHRYLIKGAGRIELLGAIRQAVRPTSGIERD